MVALAFVLSSLVAQPPTLDTYLEAPFPPADGFSAPFAKRCVGTGPAKAIGNGRVVRADAAGVEVEHLVYENGSKRILRSTLKPLASASVAVGAVVRRGEVLGVAKKRKASLTIEGEVNPCAFIAERPQLLVPQDEPSLVVIETSTYRIRLYEKGVQVAEYDVAFGQAPGPKVERGDNRTPRGMYFVINKATGPFSGPAAEAFGGYWVKLNYPNAVDAERGVDRGWIKRPAARAIARAWVARKPTNERTRLGGGIGFHGWAWEWNEAKHGRGLSWGCVVMHLRDIGAFYERVPIGAMVVIL